MHRADKMYPENVKLMLQLYEGGAYNEPTGATIIVADYDEKQIFAAAVRTGLNDR